MKYTPPLDSVDQNAPFIDGNESTGTEGSTVPAAAIEHPMREIQNAIIGAGLDEDKADLTQLLQTIRQGGRSKRVFGGNDYAEMVGGLIFQWGVATTYSGSGIWTFPIPFPNACLAVFAGEDSSNAIYGVGANPSGANNKTEGIISSEYSSTPDGIYVFAIGF
jgi:hypothetical protein